MSILYCSIIHNKEKTKISESSVGRNLKMQVKNILPEIYKNSINDRIEFEDYYLTYTRSKEIIFLCVSPKRVGEERARMFIENLINKLFNSNNSSNNDKIYASIRDCLEKHKNSKELLTYENDLQNIIDNEIKKFNTGIEDNYIKVKNIQNDVNLIKKDLNKAIVDTTNNVGNLDELLLNSKKIEGLGKEFKKGAKDLQGQTRFCCKPWVIYSTITISVILILILIYVIVALIRCENFFDAFCSDDSQ